MNFLTEGIGTTISVNQVESDGYEAKNLLASEPSLHSSRGFLAESFVRPPVTLSIKFPLCIELSHIVINPKLGKQITSAIIIHTETSYKSWTKEHNGPVSSHLVAKEFLNSPIPNVVVFRNPRFVLRRPFSALPLDHYSRYRNHDVIYNLKHPSFNANQRVVGLEITILRVAGSSVPALGGLQVWGQPCIRCGQDQVDKLYKTWSRILRRGESFLTPPLHSTDSSDEGTSAPKKAKLASSSSPVSVPDDFLDAITYEIMVQPIRLPCGLAVDALTLEKYYAEEAKFGRLPNDPFTGITFTDTFKPLSDAALKSRISSFLTLNQHDPTLSLTPRTLGSSRAGIGGGVGSGGVVAGSRGNYGYFRNPNLNLNFNSVDSAKSNCTVTSYTGPNFGYPDSDIDLSPFSDPYSHFYRPLALAPTAELGLGLGLESQCEPLSKAKATVSSIRELNLNSQDQMNYELLKILSGGANYLNKNKNKPNPKAKLDKKCKDCGLILNLQPHPYPPFQNRISTGSSTSTFYIGLCDHVILCRICLSKTDKQTRKTCSQCGVEWRAKDCLRIFV